jgi:hypothetical protein
MPEVRVQDEQGTIHVFPDGSTPEMIAKAMKVKLPGADKKTDEKKPGYFTPQNFQNLAGEAGWREQEYLDKAAGVGLRPEVEPGLLKRLGWSAMSDVEAITRVTDQITAGLMDPKTAVAFLVSKVSPAAAGAYFATQGTMGTKEAGQDIAKNGWNPQNSERLMLSLSGIAGGAALGAESPTVVRPMKTGEMLKSLKQSVKERAQPIARKVTGTESAVKKSVESEAGKQTETASGRPAEVRKTSEEIIKTKAENLEAEKTQSRKSALQVGTDKLTKDFSESLEKLEGEVYDKADQKFKDVRKKIGNPEAPAEGLIASVKSVETDVLQNIPENVKEFRSILSMEGEAEGPLSIGGGGEISPGEPGYEQVKQAYVKEGMLKEGEPLTWDKLQSLKSRIDARLRSRTRINGDLKRGLFQVRDSIVDEMGKMAESKGATAEWAEARDFWRQMKEDFQEPTGPSGSGSPVAQAYNAVDPENVRRPFMGPAGDRAIETLAKYSPELARKANAIRKLQGEADAIPKATKPKEVPKLPPKGKTPTVDIHEVALKHLEKKATEWKTWSQWDLRRMSSSLLGEFIGSFYGNRILGAGLGYTAGTLVPKYLGTLLDKPEVAEWLAKTPPAEIKILNKIPGVDKVKLVDGITEMAVERAKSGKPVKLSAEARTFLGSANVSRILAATGSKTAGQKKRELEAIRDRHSNPNMPTGEEK